MVQTRPLRLLVATAVAVMASCNAGVPLLTVGASPTTLEPTGKKARITATATNADGRIGTGSVRFSADVGTLAEETVPFDEFGTASTTYTCDRASNPDCVDRATITAQWVTDKVTVSEVIVIKLVLNTGGGGGGAGGGSATGAGDPTVLPFCGDPARPGPALCCRNPNIATSGTVYPCPATRVPAGSEIEVPFQSTAGTMASIRLKWEAAFKPTSLASCTATTPTIRAVNEPTLTITNGSNLYNILPTAYWGIPASGFTFMLGRGLPELCDIAFATGNVGSVFVLREMSFMRGSETFTQSNGMAYFFLLEKG